MAEGFANRYGSDVLSAKSAGLAPAGVVVKDTVRTMAEKNIDISTQYSKALRVDEANDFDLIVNMSGYDLPNGIRAPARVWEVEDPIGQSDAIYGQVRDQIETLVMNLVLEFRRGSRKR
ncbi:MAG: protein tyrosine phosphatase [Bryobacterales bacterium]|nr:protein tyrosine phosphatase [Bryobacterales bacterium]